MSNLQANYDLFLVIAIVTGAVCYAVWHIYEVLKPDGDPCRNCELKKNCKKFCQSKEKY
jgi:hypothetical protein